MAGDNNSMFIHRPLLTQMTIKRGIGEQGVGTRLAPLVEHGSITGEYFKRDRQRIGHIDPKRAPGEFTKRMEAEHGEMDTFSMVDRSIIKTIPEELVDGSPDSSVFDEEQNAAMEALQEIQHAHEQDVNNLLWASAEADFDAIYGANQVVTPSTKWDASGGEIRNDVRSGMNAVYKRCGYYPNTIVMPTNVFDTIQSDPNNELGERLKYTGREVPAESIMASYFGVQNVIVPRNLEDNANPGQTASFDFMWDGDNVGIFYIDPSQSRNKETLATTFYRNPPRKPFLGVQTRYNQDNESYEAKVTASYDVKLVDEACGYILYDVLG